MERVEGTGDRRSVICTSPVQGMMCGIQRSTGRLGPYRCGAPACIDLVAICRTSTAPGQFSPRPDEARARMAVAFLSHERSDHGENRRDDQNCEDGVDDGGIKAKARGAEIVRRAEGGCRNR